MFDKQYCSGCGEIMDNENQNFMCDNCIQSDMATLRSRIDKLERTLFVKANEYLV